MPSRSSTERLAEELLARVQRILDAADIEGLLATGAPPSEYEPIAALIAARLYNRRLHSVAEIEAEVFHIWNDRFGPLSPDREPAYREAIKTAAEALLQEQKDLGIVDA